MEQNGKVLSFLCKTHLNLTDQVAIGVADGRLYVSADVSTTTHESPWQSETLTSLTNRSRDGLLSGQTGIRIFSRRLIGAEPFEKLVEIPFHFVSCCVNAECGSRSGAKTYYVIHEEVIYALAYGVGGWMLLIGETPGWHMYRICLRTRTYQHFTPRLFMNDFRHCVKCIDNKLYFSHATTDEDGNTLEEYLMLYDTKIVQKPKGIGPIDVPNDHESEDVSMDDGSDDVPMEIDCDDVHKPVGQQQFIIDMSKGDLQFSFANYVSAPCCALQMHRDNEASDDSSGRVGWFRDLIFIHGPNRYECSVNEGVPAIRNTVPTTTTPTMDGAKTVSLRLSKIGRGAEDASFDIVWARERYDGPTDRTVYFVRWNEADAKEIRLTSEWLVLFPVGPNGVSSSSTFQLVDESTAVLMHGKYIATVVVNHLPKLGDMLALRLQSRWFTHKLIKNPTVRYIRSDVSVDGIRKRLRDDRDNDRSTIAVESCTEKRTNNVNYDLLSLGRSLAEAIIEQGPQKYLKVGRVRGPPNTSRHGVTGRGSITVPVDELADGLLGGIKLEGVERIPTHCGAHSTAIGRNSIAIGPYALAFGDNAFAVGVNAVAIGENARAVGDFTRAYGAKARATGAFAVFQRHREPDLLYLDRNQFQRFDRLINLFKKPVSSLFDLY